MTSTWVISSGRRPSSRTKTACEKFVQLLWDHHVSQMQREPTREGRVLDLFCTNKPSLVKAMSTISGISDHDAIVADCDIRPAFCKKKPRTIFLFSKANWSQMKVDMNNFTLHSWQLFPTAQWKKTGPLLRSIFHC